MRKKILTLFILIASLFTMMMVNSVEVSAEYDNAPFVPTNVTRP